MFDLKYVVDDTTWRDFQPAHSYPGPLPVGCLLVAAWFDAGLEPELWAVEGMLGVDELRRYYRTQLGDKNVPFTVSVIMLSEKFESEVKA